MCEVPAEKLQQLTSEEEGSFHFLYGLFSTAMLVQLQVTSWIYLSNTMQQSPSWKSNSFSSSQEILYILLNPKVEHHIHNCLPLVTVMNHVCLYCNFLNSVTLVQSVVILCVLIFRW